MDKPSVFVMNNGVEMPHLAYGTWRLPKENGTTEAVLQALQAGYRHIDTAAAYGNEDFVGQALQASEIPREELFITGKLWNASRSYDGAINACKASLKALCVEYLDLYLIHWPITQGESAAWQEENLQTWKGLEALYEQGYVRAIGVSNFFPEHLEYLIKNADVLPMANQLEIHPGMLQREVVDFCQKEEIVVSGWGTLGNAKMLRNAKLNEIADKCGCTTAQLCIKWSLDNGILPITKTKNMQRMMENLAADKVCLSEEDRIFINEIEYFAGSGLRPDNAHRFL